MDPNLNLYEHESQLISVETFIKAMKPHIKKGDTLFLEIDTMRFGAIVPGISKNDLMEGIFTVFQSLVGEEGNIVVPTFSYSWGDDCPYKYFDVINTPSKVGVFSEYFRTRSGVRRSSDPMFSQGVRGKDQSWLVQNSNTTFGKGSMYEKAHQLKAKLISFGLKKYDPTFIHYIEQHFHEEVEELDYRFIKRYAGILVDEQGKEREGEQYYFSRHRDLLLKFDETRLVLDLLTQKKLALFKVGNGEIGISDAEAVFETGRRGLQQDRHYFMKKVEKK